MGHSSQPPEDSTPSTEELKQAEAQRQQQLFDWANNLLEKLGLMQQLSQASSLDELDNIKLDLECYDVMTAIHAALHPAIGQPANCFLHRKEGALKRILKNCFDGHKKYRKQVLEAQSAQSSASTFSTASPFDAADAPTPADTVRRMLEHYVTLDPHEYVAVALWIIHTHIYERFMVTPRLLLTSPVRSCGKTTLLDVIGRLVARPEKSDSITPAAIYHIIHETQRTLLLDEADNLDLSAQHILRAVLNAGHRQGGTVTRMYRGGAKRLSVYAPIALASIGWLPLPLMSRSIVVRMRRHDEARSLRRFDLADTSDLDLVYGHIRHWVNGVVLALDPDIPAELRGRHADNWRPLLSIADACGPEWSVHARDAAVAFSRGDREEDIAVTLLFHVRDVFDALAADRLASKRLTDELISLDSADAAWAEYRGPSGTERPRKLTQGALAALLRPFGIRPRTIWPLARTATTKSFRGYYRADFDAVWQSYCDGGVTPSQPRQIRRLRSV